MGIHVFGSIENYKIISYLRKNNPTFINEVKSTRIGVGWTVGTQRPEGIAFELHKSHHLFLQAQTHIDQFNGSK